MPARKQATKKTPPPPPIRGNSRSHTRVDVANDNDDDDDDDDRELDEDRALALFYKRAPAGADHVIAFVVTPAGDHVMHDRTVADARARPVELAQQTIESADRWARTEGRELKFRAVWRAGDRVLGTYQWKSGDGDPTALDGTVDAFLSQQQRHGEVEHRLHLEGFTMVQDAWRALQSSCMKRIEALEKDNEQLRDRLRKAGDVDAEIAVQQVASDLEARARTADIMEHRVLPVLQHLLISRMPGLAPAAAAAANSNGEQAASPAPPATPEAAA